jgi:hypothetical protein
LWGRAFTVRTDHFSLKYILDQRLSTIPQHTWVNKLFGYDMEVEYRPGKMNGAADALSRRDEEPTAAVNLLSTPTLEVFDTLRKEALTDPQVQELKTQLAARTAGEGWTERDGLLVCRGRVFVPDNSSVWDQLLIAAHAAGHEGVEKTLHRWRSSFHNTHIRRRVQEFVRGCAVCQRNKSEHLHLLGYYSHCQFPLKYGVTSPWTS